MVGNATWIRQAGVIPLRAGQVCLVTSRSGKRWVIPKGIIDPGMTAGTAALQEAWEEAGLTGTLESEPVGSYTYDKGGAVCHVIVFVMRVTAAAEDWPERTQRQREWVDFKEALARLEDEGLRTLLGQAQGRRPK